MKTYILTKDQLRLAVLIGAKEQGIIPDYVATAFLNSPSEIEFNKVENGAVITVPNPPSIEETDIETSDEVDDNVTYGTDLQIKEALSAVMERPPGLNTIKSWSEPQKVEAWKWATHLDPMPDRPAFIKERKVRTTVIGTRITSVEDETPDVVAGPPAGDAVSQYFEEA